MKKFKKSPIAIVCYVFAAIFAVYLISTEVSSVHSIYEYYAPYDMTPGFSEVLMYAIQQGITPLAAAIVTCMAGLILEEVRKLNPANWTEAAEEKAPAAEETAEVEIADADASEDTVVFEEDAETVSEEAEAAAEEAAEEAEAAAEDAEAVAAEAEAAVEEAAEEAEKKAE